MSGDVTDRSEKRSAFTLIELLVAVAIIAMLLAILLPSLAAARQESRSAVCRSNLRQVYITARMYADSHRGWGPALGHPYTELPNWALVVQRYAAFKSGPGSRMFSPESVLVCPTIQSHYAEVMNRTYATNVTGYAGLPGDAGNYDDPDGPAAHVKIDRIARPADLPIGLDSARTSVVTDGPPALRTSSVIDFRQELQVVHRVGWFHANRQAFNAAMYDGSCYPWRRVPSAWETPLP
jgi:prepilin-type N-terminal cleavage/methylation domain-containing protein